MQRKGFTLIELLVVIAIIAILAAILFPVFLQAKEKSRQSTCLNNATQLAKAGIQYRQDWNGTFPTPDWVITNSGQPYGAFHVLKDYIKSTAVLTCPSLKKIPANPTHINYLFNGKMTTDPNRQYALWGFYRHPGGNFKPVNEGQVVSPTRVIDIQCTPSDWGIGGVTDFFWPWEYYGYPGGSHNDGCNFGFVDGHAQWFKTANITGWTTNTLPKYRISFRYDYR